MSVAHVFSNYPHHVVGMVDFFNDVDAIDRIATFYVAIDEEKDKEEYSAFDNINIVFYKNFGELIATLKKDPDTLVIFHSLFSYEQWLEILRGGIGRQSVWVVWGAELYKHVLKKPEGETLKQWLKKNIELWMKRIALLSLKKVIVLTDGDAELVASKLWKKKNVDVLRYPMTGYNEKYFYNKDKEQGEPKGVHKIICGNSADPTNNHLEMLDALAKFSGENIEIHMPLNYGASKEYVEEVIAHGKKLFGEKFFPLTELMERRPYDAFLGSMDAGVFFHNRQQGLYVACSMMVQGKLMYIKESVSSYYEFSDMGMHVRDSLKISSMEYGEFSTIPHDIAVKSSEIAQRTYTEKYLAVEWRKFILRMKES